MIGNKFEEFVEAVRWWTAFILFAWLAGVAVAFLTGGWKWMGGIVLGLSAVAVVALVFSVFHYLLSREG